MAVNVQSVVGQASPVLARKVVLKHSKAARVTPQRRSLAVRAAATGPGSPKRPELLHTVLQGADQFLTVRILGHAVRVCLTATPQHITVLGIKLPIAKDQGQPR